MVFAVVEQKEPHAGRMAFAEVAQPGTFAERCTLARRIRDELEVPLPIFVDGMDDASRALFSDLPSPAFLIDRQGRIVDKLPWADPMPLTAALAAVLAQDQELPAVKSAGWVVDQRDVFARRLLAAGKPHEALAWLDAKSDPAPSVPPTFVALARAAIARVQATRDGSTDERAEAIEAARKAIGAAWEGDPLRRAAARVELADAAAGTPHAVTLWGDALAGLDARTEGAVRVWIRQQLDRATTTADQSAHRAPRAR
ncbi:MAG: hypothetical protein JNK15_22725 [Planctomycetes bacterium]|nr:hypothetical protein [Planctomycetota bacterium]